MRHVCFQLWLESEELNPIKPSSWIEVENERFYAIREGATMKPIPSRFRHMSRSEFLYLGLPPISVLKLVFFKHGCFPHACYQHGKSKSPHKSNVRVRVKFKWPLWWIRFWTQDWPKLKNMSLKLRGLYSLKRGPPRFGWWHFLIIFFNKASSRLLWSWMGPSNHIVANPHIFFKIFDVDPSVNSLGPNGLLSTNRVTWFWSFFGHGP